MGKASAKPADQRVALIGRCGQIVDDKLADRSVVQAAAAHQGLDGIAHDVGLGQEIPRTEDAALQIQRTLAAAPGKVADPHQL